MDRITRTYTAMFTRLDVPDDEVQVQTFTVTGETPCLAQGAAWEQLEAWKKTQEGLDYSSWRLSLNQV